MKFLKRNFFILISIIIGFLYSFTIFNISFIKGTNTFWTKPFGDRITNIIGELYYIHDSWHYPIFFVPKLSIPEGTNIVYTDSLPFLALIAKVIFKLTGISFNYFGMWEFLCFPLLSLFVALSIKEGGSKSIFVIICAILLSLSNPALLVRFGHIALMSHFLILWSLYLYLRIVHQPKSLNGTIQFCIVATLAVLLQAYFLLMVMPFFLAALLTVIKEKKLSFKNALTQFTVVIGVILGVAFTSGIIGPGSPTSSAWGFGFYSMNLISPFLPPREHLPIFISKFVTWDGNGYSWDATGGQYEGYNYLGLGLLFLLLINIYYSRNIIKHNIKHHFFLFAALFCLILYALSYKIYIGNFYTTITPIYAPLEYITDHFRVSGRFFWPVYYVLVVSLVLITLHNFNSRLSKFLLVLAVTFQLMDTQILHKNFSEGVNHGVHQLLAQDTWKPLLEGHNFLIQYPSFQCGGWAKKWPENNSNMELLLLTAKLNRPTNSAYLARSNRDCNAELAEGLSFNIKKGGLYIYGNTFPIYKLEYMPNFRRWCRGFKFGIVCLRDWENFPKIPQSFFRISNEWAPEYQLGKILRFKANGNGVKFRLF